MAPNPRLRKPDPATRHTGGKAAKVANNAARRMEPTAVAGRRIERKAERREARRAR